MQNSEETQPNSVHASLEELLAIRDGEQIAKSSHVSACTFCQARLEDVYSAASSLQATMLFDADLPVPSGVWGSLEDKLRANGVTEIERVDDIASTNIPEDRGVTPESLLNQSINNVSNLSASNLNPSKPSFWTSINTAIYSLAAAVMFTGMVNFYNSQDQQQTQLETRTLNASIQTLMDSSRGLENVLHEVIAQNRNLAISDQALADRLQWQLMLVDQEIHESERSDELSYEQVRALWDKRVNALTELNKLYYTNQVAVYDAQF